MYVNQVMVLFLLFQDHPKRAKMQSNCAFSKKHYINNDIKYNMQWSSQWVVVPQKANLLADNIHTLIWRDAVSHAQIKITPNNLGASGDDSWVVSSVLWQVTL